MVTPVSCCSKHVPCCCGIMVARGSLVVVVALTWPACREHSATQTRNQPGGATTAISSSAGVRVESAPLVSASTAPPAGVEVDEPEDDPGFAKQGKAKLRIDEAVGRFVTEGQFVQAVLPVQEYHSPSGKYF